MSPHRIPPALSLLGSLSKSYEVAVGVALRLAETPAVMWVGAFMASAGMALLHDPFTLALGMLVFASILDYVSGVATARGIPHGLPNSYDPARAAKGRREKIITGVLMIGCRMMEGLATQMGILDIGGALRWFGAETLANSTVIQQGGILTTVVTMLIAAQELYSVYQHRLANGGSRIFILEFVFTTISFVQTVVLGRAASKVAQWANNDAGDDLMKRWKAQEMMDDAAHKVKHGAPAPRRRQYDIALADAEEAASEKADDEREQRDTGNGTS